MQNNLKHPLKMSVFAVGGGGKNIVSTSKIMNEDKSVNFVAIDTDEDHKSLIKTEIIVKNPSDAAEIEHKVANLLNDMECAIIIAAFGGETGTNITPLLLNILHQKKILTLCIVTTPFAFEGNRKISKALVAIEQIKESKTAVIVYNNNDSIKEVRDLPMGKAFEYMDNKIADTLSEVVSGGAKGIDSYAAQWGFRE